MTIKDEEEVGGITHCRSKALDKKTLRGLLLALCSDKRSYVVVHNFPTDLLFFDVFDAQIKMWVESLQTGVCVFTKGDVK